VAITVSEPIQTPTQTPSTAITNDQPSSSSSTIQTLQQPPPNMLKSEKGGVRGEGRMKRGGGEGPKSPHFVDGKF